MAVTPPPYTRPCLPHAPHSALITLLAPLPSLLRASTLALASCLIYTSTLSLAPWLI